MDLFDYEDYHKFLKDYVHHQPNKGYGLSIKIAKALNTNPSIVSQVLSKKMDFTIEQGNDLCEFLGLSELESDYFLNLILLNRAGKENLRERILKKLADLRRKSRDLSQRMPAQGKLKESDEAQFYSQWYYSGIRIASSIEKYQTVDTLCELFHLPRVTVRKVIEFLVATGLCIEEKGLIKMGPKSTHIGSESPLVSRHHINWRQKSIECANNIKNDELYFTSPISIAEKDIAHVRKVLVDAIDEAFKLIDPSPPESLACLNIDFFRVR